MHGVLDDPGFEAAFVGAVLLSVVVMIMARGDGEPRGAPAVAVLGALVGYSVEEELDVLLVVGLGALAVGAWATYGARPFALRFLATAPGATPMGLSLPAGCLPAPASLPSPPP